jgi:hypothetical protein
MSEDKISQLGKDLRAIREEIIAAGEADPEQVKSAEMLRLSSKLKELCELEFNWDGYGAGPVNTTTALLAMDIAERLEEMFPHGWQAVPGPSGNNLQLEIHNKRLDLEIYLVIHKQED